MKRMVSLFLVSVLLLGLFGCQAPAPKQEDPGFAPLPMIPGATYSSFGGMNIQIDSLNWYEDEGKTSLVVVWDNDTGYDVMYGESYVIERLDGDDWVSCAVRDDLVFTCIGYVLKAGRMQNKSYNLTNTYDVWAPGTYRFKSDCFVYETPGKSTECELIAEFTVGDIKRPGTGMETGTQVGWCAQYIRTDGTAEGVLFPSVRIIQSLQELTDYYNTWHEVFSLGRKETAYADTTIGFLDACDQYDEAFFEKNYLLFVLLEEGSGSIRHEVRNVTQTADQKLTISIDRKVPDAGTCDMAQWHILLEVSRDVRIEDTGDVIVNVDGRTSYMDDAIVYPKQEAAFKSPPEGKLITPDGEETLRLGGYSWIYSLGNGLENGVIADQSGRPIPREVLHPVTVSSQFAETVYAPVPGSDAFAPTNALGYLVKVQWEVNPTSVTYTCWPDAVWQQSDVPEVSVVSRKDFAFYAKTGGYVYEIVAEWKDAGGGYTGTANYYVYIKG